MRQFEYNESNTVSALMMQYASQVLSFESWVNDTKAFNLALI